MVTLSRAADDEDDEDDDDDDDDNDDVCQRQVRRRASTSSRSHTRHSNSPGCLRVTSFPLRVSASTATSSAAATPTSGRPSRRR